MPVGTPFGFMRFERDLDGRFARRSILRPTHINCIDLVRTGRVCPPWSSNTPKTTER